MTEFTQEEVISIESKIRSLENEEGERSLALSRIMEVREGLQRILQSDAKDIDGTTLSDARKQTLKTNLFATADTFIS